MRAKNPRVTLEDRRDGQRHEWVARVTENGDVSLLDRGGTGFFKMSSDAARQLARWILDTFGDPMPDACIKCEEKNDLLADTKLRIDMAVKGAVMEEREALLPLLIEAEWAGYTWGDSTCPWCGGFLSVDLPGIPGRHLPEPRGHKTDCRWVAAVRARNA